MTIFVKAKLNNIDMTLHDLFTNPGFSALLVLAVCVVYALMATVVLIIIMWPKKGEVLKYFPFLCCWIGHGVCSQIIGMFTWRSVTIGWIGMAVLTVYMLQTCRKWKQLNFWRGLFVMLSPVCQIIVDILYFSGIKLL